MPPKRNESFDYAKMTVVQLRVLLKEKGRPVSGKKAELVERLKNAIVKDDKPKSKSKAKKKCRSNDEDCLCLRKKSEIVKIAVEKLGIEEEKAKKFTVKKLCEKINSGIYPKILQDSNLYEETVLEIKNIAETIGTEKSECDGRIDSAMKELPFLNKLKEILIDRHPSWEVIIAPPRASCDIMVNSIRINLKLTDCKSADNSVNKPMIYYSITGLTTYPYSSNWNKFYEKLEDAKRSHKIKTVRNKQTEYHYLVKNKINGKVLLKPIFDIYTYISNPSNDLQINWKTEFSNIDYYTTDLLYTEKVKTLLLCIQRSVKSLIESVDNFAKANIDSLFTKE